MHNLIIIGSGPAGFTAAIYASRAKLEPVLFSGSEIGGQLMNTTEVENFPGFPEGIIGPKLMTDMRTQADKFGTKIIDKKVTKVDLSGEIKKVYAGEEEFQAKTVIVATGATSIMLGVPGEKELIGKGVSTCAVCDAPFYQDKKVFVIGGGDSAMEDALALAKFTKSVTVVHRKKEFRASKIMQEKVLENSNIKVMWESELKEIVGDEKVKEVKIMSAGELVTLPADGVFLAIGHKPATGLIKDQLELDQDYLKTGFDKKFTTQTNINGVFGAGDVVDFNYRQAVTAAGMGCEAALDAERWLNEQ
jgi:thioredoxin reductase (NADPH)